MRDSCVQLFSLAAGLGFLLLFASCFGFGWRAIMEATHDLGADLNGDRVYSSHHTTCIPDFTLVRDKERQVLNVLGMRLVLIPPGRFIMGSPSWEEVRQADEWPHCVNMTRAFYISVHEVTRGEFRKFIDDTGYRAECETNEIGGEGMSKPGQPLHWSKAYSWRHPGFPQSDGEPVINVTWKDAAMFCEWLSRKQGCTCRLPTEAEWEYSGRGGTQTAFAYGSLEELMAAGANVFGSLTSPSPHVRIPQGDRFRLTAPVGAFPPNRFGLHDMHGNVREWCSDWYGPDYYLHSGKTDPQGPATGERRVVRGGSFNSQIFSARSACRGQLPPDLASCDVGFRIVQDGPGRASR
jgi:formylglycine-generating enzyme